MVMAAIPLIASAIPAVKSMIDSFKTPQQPAAQPAAAPQMISDVRVPEAPTVLAVTPSGQVITGTQQAALGQLAQHYAQQPMQAYQAQVARAQVRHVTGAIDPQLAQIQRQLDHRATQVQATAEHRRIEERDKFRRAVLGRLAAIERAARISHY